MFCLKKLGLILWKNWLFRRRHYVMTALEIILPSLFAASLYLMALMRWTGGEAARTVYQSNFTRFKPFDLALTDPDVLRFYSRDKSYFLYYPNTSAALDLLTYINSYTDTKLVFEGVANESDIDATTMNWNFHEKEIIGAVVFEGLSERGDLFADRLKYKIRLDSVWFTDEIELIQDRKGPPMGNIYTTRITFICIQHAIAVRAIERKTNQTDLFANYKVSTVPFPYPPYYNDDEFSMILKILLPLYITLSFIFTAPITVRRIVREKEIGIKELMKLMGIPAWVQWFGWFVSSFIIMATSAVIIVAFLCIRPDEETIAVLQNSASELVYIIFLFYIASAICFSFFISSLFTKPTLAAGITVLVWILSFCVPYYSIFEKYRSLRSSQKLSLALLPNMAIAWALSIVAEYEAQGEGIRWYNLNSPTRGDNISILQVLTLMLFDSFLYVALTWYVDNVFPGAYGIPKPFYFLFTKSYWKRGKFAEYGNCANEAMTANNKDKFEEEPVGLSPCIAIRNLSKAYGLKSGALAVDNLSLNIYEGQITALLGHNGAGKTTTMSILTGMFPPSKGTAFVNGYDIRTEVDRARQDLGLCPQFNMLFDRLTVEEHLIFFGKLKVNCPKELDTQVKELMHKLQISDKKNTFAMDLSGGMKRKLNLGIALIGGPKVVMLDEPTSGMDPEARRSIWDLLQEYRTNRCILLSTHFMEEADILGDRIAIMANGQVECCGSPLFLKKQYGAGYHLTVCLQDDSRANEITDTVNTHIAGVILETSRECELSYNLPSADTGHFPRLFDNLETNSDALRIKSFGLSVTTMEEVFLKVGESVAAEDENEDENEDNALQSAAPTLELESEVIKNTGISLKVQQFYALLLKRFFYTRRCLAILAIQLFLPLATTLLFVLINNSAAKVDAVHKPALLLDLAPYKHCVAFVHRGSRVIKDRAMADYYRSSFPAACTVHNENDPVAYIEKTAIDNFLFYRDKLLFGSSFDGDGKEFEVQIWYNNHFRHTLPTALNVVHNAMLKYGARNASISLLVENAPLKSAAEMDDFVYQANLMRGFLAILMGVFMPVGLCVLTASFIVFPVHERVTKCKHIQLTTGVGAVSFWVSSFLWDFSIAVVSCSAAVIIIAVFDTSNIFDPENIAITFFTLLLYCWASIPFTYLASFLCGLPAAGFTAVTIVNVTTGIIFGIWVFVRAELSPDWKWLCSLVPNFSGTLAFMKIVYLGDSNNSCKNQDQTILQFVCKHRSPTSSSSWALAKILRCCPPEFCGEFCLEQKPYLVWDWPGLGPDLLSLALDGFVYFIIIFLIESSYWYKLCHFINQTIMHYVWRNRITLECAAEALDSDVYAEKQRVDDIISHTNANRRDYLLVHDLTKHFRKLTAVDGLSFGVENGTCFGLLGINGAGKTTTFRQLIGDLLIDSGQATIQQFSITRNRFQYLSNIGYCPQFDALLDHLTGKELLLVFANLHGIPKAHIKHTVNETIINFDLTEHADKPTLAYSGGNKRKLSAALAFIGRPAVAFLDEPTTGVDPTARRKIWNMIKESNKHGTAIVLSSHSMEECEVLCSRVGIMVNGQFECLGGIQYLKNKFSQGYTILAKLKRPDKVNQNGLQRFIKSEFPSAALKDVHQGLVHYQVKDPDTKLTKLFESMEKAKTTFDLEDYSVTQATLEQVFLSFARKQREVSDQK